MGEAKFRARRCATPGTTAVCELLNRTALHDRRPAVPHQPTAAPSMVTPPQFLRRDARTLPAIRSLPRPGNLVLFTPVVPPEPEPVPESTSSHFPEDYHAGAGGAVPSPPFSTRASGDAPIDPFEPLGRALSRHHARVRHVPYVPGVAMTGTHRTFLQHASAIVLVVVCSGGREERRETDQGRKRPSPVSLDAAQQQQQQQQQNHFPDRSSYVLPPPRQSSSTPTPASFNRKPLPPSSRCVRPAQSSDPFFKFASQVLITAADLRERRETDCGDPAYPHSIPTVLLIVGEDEAETVRQFGQLEMLMDGLASEHDTHFQLGPQTVLVSRSYSTCALRRVAGMIFGSEA